MKTCVGVVLMCRHCGCGSEYYWWVHVKVVKAALLHSETVAGYAPLGLLLYLLNSSR